MSTPAPTVARIQAAGPAAAALTAPGVRCPSCNHTVPVLVEGTDLCLHCDSRIASRSVA